MNKLCNSDAQHHGAGARFVVHVLHLIDLLLDFDAYSSVVLFLPITPGTCMLP